MTTRCHIYYHFRLFKKEKEKLKILRILRCFNGKDKNNGIALFKRQNNNHILFTMNCWQMGRISDFVGGRLEDFPFSSSVAVISFVTLKF